jgi:hypothetical protein
MWFRSENCVTALGALHSGKECPRHEAALQANREDIVHGCDTTLGAMNPYGVRNQVYGGQAMAEERGA